MPTINLNDNTTSQSSTTTITPPTNPAPIQRPTPPQMPNNNWNDPWGSPWDQPMGNPNPNSNTKRMSPQERVTMIEECYSEILGRKPDTRDINYYKYSTLSEEEIKKQLLTGNEHKQLLLDGRDYKKLKDRTTQAETRIKVLEGQILDQVEEFKQLTNLLKEKNKYIHELRERLNNERNEQPYSIKRDNSSAPLSIKTISEIPQQNQTHFVNQNNSNVNKESKGETILEKIIKFISSLF